MEIVLECDAHHGSTLVLACCKANHWSHGKKVNFVQPRSAYPSTDSNQNLHRSLRKVDQQLCQIGKDCIIQAFITRVWNIKFLCVFIVSFLFLPFPFLFLLSPTAWTDVHGWWLKMRGLVQGSAFCTFELCQITLWRHFHANGKTLLNQKLCMIDVLILSKANIKSGSHFQNPPQWITFSAH